MNIKQAVGYLLSVRLSGQTLDKKTEHALHDGSIGGVVLFKENALDLKQLAQLISNIKKSSFHPLMISTDQEGGAVQRFDHIISPLPSAMALSAANDLALLKTIAEISAKQLKLLGFNCQLAPVLDVLQNPINSVIATRSYGNTVDFVTKCASQHLQAMKRNQMIAVGKHFPGHGSTVQDSHFELAVNESPIEEVWSTDLAPFKACLQDLPAILVAHVWLSHVDPEPLPATLSSRVVNDILRQYLHYDGLVITDSFDMKAIADKWSPEEASLMAINAGVDHLLLCLEVDQLLSVHKYLCSAIESGKLTEERIYSSVKRMQKLFTKEDQASTIDQTEQLELLNESIKSSYPTVLEGAIKGITVLKGEIPKINSGEWLIVKPNHARYPLKLAAQLNKRVEEMNKSGDSEKLNLRFTELSYTLDPPDSEAEEMGAECAERNCILLTFRSLTNQGQFRLAQAIRDNAREHLHIACDLPYDLIGLTDWKNCLATYDPSDLAMRALTEILLGQAKPFGTCPLNLNLRVRIGEPEV